MSPVNHLGEYEPRTQTQKPVLTVGELRTRLLAASEGATANALQCVSTNHPADQDVALAAKNWSQAALAAAQAYKTLGSPSDRGMGR